MTEGTRRALVPKAVLALSILGSCAAAGSVRGSRGSPGVAFSEMRSAKASNSGWSTAGRRPGAAAISDGIRAARGKRGVRVAMKAAPSYTVTRCGRGSHGAVHRRGSRGFGRRAAWNLGWEMVTEAGPKLGSELEILGRLEESESDAC